MKKVNDTYTIQANLNLFVSVEISASSMDEALQKAKELKVPDFVKFEGDWLDGEHEITGIFK